MPVYFNGYKSCSRKCKKKKFPTLFIVTNARYAIGLIKKTTINICSRYLQDDNNSYQSIFVIVGWLTVRGKFFMVNGANVSCACTRSPQGFSPHCHIGDGCVDVILVRHTSLFNNIRMLLRLSSKQKTLVIIVLFDLFH